MNKTFSEEIYLEDTADATTSTKKLLTYGLFVFAVCGAVGCAIPFYKGPQTLAVHLAGYGILGCLFTTFARKKGSSLATGKPALAFLLALLVCGVFATYQYFFAKWPVTVVVAAVSAFLVPFFIFESWLRFVSIPAVHPSLWYYRPDLPPAPKVVYLENTPIKIKVITAGKASKKISVSTPVQIQLGLAFYYAALGHAAGKEFSFLDEDGQPYGWAFYIERFGFWRKNLDPDETLYDNGVKPKSVIIAECITHPINN